MRMLNRENLWQRIMETIGISDPVNENGVVEPRKISIKHNIVN